MAQKKNCSSKILFITILVIFSLTALSFTGNSLVNCSARFEKGVLLGYLLGRQQAGAHSVQLPIPLLLKSIS